MSNNKCLTIDEISHGGVRRCRDTDVTSSGSSKRRKFECIDHENVVTQSGNDIRGGVDVNSPVSSTESDSCDHGYSSSCFENCLRLDLKAEHRVERETFMSVNDSFSEVMSPTGETCLNSDEIESFSTMKKKKAAPPRVVTCHRKPRATSAKLPTAEEIDEFFSVIEKKEQKRFSDKYNFDIVNDVPMDGRYQWVRLKP